MSNREFIIGTRSSRLALRQAEIATASLQLTHHHSCLRVITIRTTGDRQSQSSLSQIGGQGVFIAELERSLQKGEIDIAVHSLKDMPSQNSPGLTIAAVSEREDVRDALISRDGHTLASLPPGATIGTGSARRAGQLAALRNDLNVVDIRGNVDTRIRKAQGGQVDGVLLAAAGLSRLGCLEQATELIPIETMLPAVGQGALALQVRSSDVEALNLVGALDHQQTRLTTNSERAFLRRLGSGCQSAVAALGELSNSNLIHLRGLVADTNGRLLKGDLTGATDEAELIGIRLAEQLLAQGASSLLKPTS